MNTYTQNQVANALNILETVFKDHPNYLDLPSDSKERFALIVLQAFHIEPKAGE